MAVYIICLQMFPETYTSITDTVQDKIQWKKSRMRMKRHFHYLMKQGDITTPFMLLWLRHLLCNTVWIYLVLISTIYVVVTLEL